mmetsp:Transcript_10269/g.16035  ORF Transcript_10269/g.16035 Transcript_10269/m.16035 type:complete len:122 (+) Transcript_10269:318-683(+)
MSADWSTAAFKRVGTAFFAMQVLYSAEDAAGRKLMELDDEVLGSAKAGLISTNNAKDSMFNDELIQLIACQNELDLSPVCSIVAGMVADQIIKSVSGREKPLKNFFYFDGRDGAGAVVTLK